MFPACAASFAFSYISPSGTKPEPPSEKFTHCYWVTTQQVARGPETFSMHFLPKDKCKISLNRKAISSQTSAAAARLSDNRVYTHVWTEPIC